MRVLVIAKDFPSERQPGAGIFVLRQLQALARRGHEFRVVRIVPHAPPWNERWRDYRAIPNSETAGGIEVTTIRALFPPRMLALEYLPLQVEPAMRRVVAEFQPELVHAHFLIPSGQLAVRRSLPTIVTAHGSDAYDWAWRRPGLHRAACEAIARAGILAAVSEFIARRVRALVDRDVEIVFNGADESIFAPRDMLAARKALSIPPEHFVVGFAGRPTREKGAFDLVEAAALLADIRPIVVAAGPAQDAGELLRFAESQKVELRFLGMLEHDRLALLHNASDVFTLPSYREGLPAAICEAMLSGCPVVTTPAGGIPEIVRDGTSGYLVPVASPALLAERLRVLAHDPSLRAAMGAAAHGFAREHLTWSANARRYDALYARARAVAA